MTSLGTHFEHRDQRRVRTLRGDPAAFHSLLAHLQRCGARGELLLVETDTARMSTRAALTSDGDGEPDRVLQQWPMRYRPRSIWSFDD